jgi:AmmeMemoRadiSam system protein B
MLRRAAVAGSWYPSAPARLKAAVEEHLRYADEASGTTDDRAGELVALVSPHAGLVYSGPVAAHGYRLLRQRPLDVIVLVGPSHYVPFTGVSIWPRGAFETPFGALRIDETAAQELIDRCPAVRMLPEAHGREHSLEMQLPFLALLAGEVPILPLVMGQQTRATAFALGDALADLARTRRAVFVASSDLTHFLDARTAAQLDAVVVRKVEALDADGLMAVLEKRPDHACGGGPMVSVLRASTLLGATRGEALRYADSGDVSGDKSSVVGYLSAAIWK